MNWINRTIMHFTIMSACLDPMKLIYVGLLGFIVPIGFKLSSLLHGSTDSQTFEMLTGKVGVSFILMVLCLGLAGNTATQSGRGGEYLPLIFTRPLTKTQYVITKWVTITIIGGGLAALQNLIVAGFGFCFGEVLSPEAVISSVIERVLDAAIISAAMILSMLNKNPIFQIVSIMAFYIWLTGQTIPPVSVAGPAATEVDDMSIEGTKLLLTTSQVVADLILPTLNIYDMVNAGQISIVPVLAYVSTLSLYLILSITFANRREFFYGTS